MSPWRHAFALMLILSGVGSAVAEEDYRLEPVEDAALESRLARESVFSTREGDTLVDLARLLYGHTTWWVKLRAENPLLREFGPSQKLKAGTPIRHRSPEIAGEYVVQPGDWLVRIAIWKYGSLEQWSKILSKNEAKISNPDLIRPGDRLIFGQDGSIRNERTHEVLVEGVEGELFEEARILASLADQEGSFSGWAARYHRRNLIAALTGLLLLLISIVGYVRS